MASDDDIAKDKQFAVAAAFLVVSEVALAGLADGGYLAIWLWVILAVVAVGVTALLATRFAR